ncbi:MAG: hypothetical protein HY055_14440 [Magnetospirillum sp.]|uniref:Uncharacterized protein n=1 Tax=Paramagnetospirillum magnetotacticum MS-1 TaxID=272627 RepID=A0A0C2U9T4_PARME|nr:hypothetical protein [Paramagnetospirillum magnetotacticum]KIL98247.1 hypothetical protein CCC_01308 [Paramagnetospirillum magnetotacticum MS-1]MBI3446513.1 hypothetical protein [Magnetospirillum sp.]
MTYDFNDAQPQMMPQGEVIPDGTFAKIRMTIRPGGTNGSAPMDAGLLKASADSDAKMLDCEFTVVEGRFVRRKFWQNFTVSGGKLDDKGQSKGWNISKASFRAMVDSALGLNPKDMSEAAKAKRVIQGLKQLDGIVFVARIMVEPPSDPKFRARNKLANVVLPGEPQFDAVMRGEEVEPDPVDAKPQKSASGTVAQNAPAWAADAAPAPSSSAGAQQPGGASWTQQPPAAAPPQASPQPAANGPAWLNG